MTTKTAAARTARQLEFSTGWKRCHLAPGVESLETILLREGLIDVDLDTGLVFSVRNGIRVPMAISLTKKGYAYVQLQKEKSRKQGSQHRDGARTRYRTRRNALVHRIVKIKSIAVAMGGSRWRDHVRPLPRRVDVNHIDRNRFNNAASNLELQTEAANRARQESKDHEIDSLHEGVF